MKHFGVNFLCIFFAFAATAVAQRVTQPVGLAHACTYKINQVSISVLIKFPLEFSGTLINWSKGSPGFLPDRFLFSDGTIERQFIQVDKSSGTALAKYLHSIKNFIAKNLGYKTADQIPQEAVLQYLAANIHQFLLWAEQTDNVGIYGYQPTTALINQFNSEHALDFEKLYSLPRGQWIETTHRHSTVSFERVLASQKGFCIDMALLASFILESFHIQHRVIFGGVQSFDGTGGGHTWIELADERILDVAWQTLGKPTRHRHLENKDWLWFGNAKGYQYRYEYDFFPIIKLK